MSTHPTPDPTSTSVDLVIAAGQLIRRVTKEAFTGDNATTWRTLSIIDQYPGTNVTAFARAYGCSQPVATRHIARLEEENLIRRAAGQDNRSSALHLTEKGVATLAAHRASAAEYLAEGFAALSQEDLTAVARTVDVIGRVLATTPRGNA